MQVRLKKSWGSADQLKRGIAISNAKKGKPTNQNKIMGERYATMSDSEFESFLLKNIKPVSHRRLINLRNKYT